MSRRRQTNFVSLNPHPGEGHADAVPEARSEPALRQFALADGVVSSVLPTVRGNFAVLIRRTQDSSLPRGSVLLVPGFTGSKEDFAPLLPNLADAGWVCASYDQRGQFESAAAPDDDFSLTGFASDAVAVAGGLFGSSEQVHLVGHSFGGLVSAAAAVASPDAWASVTLLCSGPGGLGGSARAELLDAVAVLESEGLESAYRRTIERERKQGMPLPPPDVERWLHHRFLANSPGSLAAIARHVAEAPDLTAKLAALGVPLFVVRGEFDDAWPHAVQEKLAEALGTRVVVIERAAHSPARGAPEATRDALVRLWMG